MAVGDSPTTPGDMAYQSLTGSVDAEIGAAKREESQARPGSGDIGAHIGGAFEDAE